MPSLKDKNTRGQLVDKFIIKLPKLLKMDFVILLSLVISKWIVSGQSFIEKYAVRNVLTGKTCPSVVFTTDAVSVLHCATLCARHTNCKSIFYERGAITCTGCDGFYTADDVTSWPDDTGTAEYFGPYGEYCVADIKGYLLLLVQR